ncbi:MAG: hypothetical protein ACRD1T_19735, partial [Acidimicrobiia bacterium]
MVRYPEGGGWWSALLQHLFGLRALGHDVFWLAPFPATTSLQDDERRIRIFLRRFRYYGFGGRCAVLRYLGEREQLSPENGQVYGLRRGDLSETLRSADMVWNFCSSLRGPLLAMFKRRVLVDLDPGHLHVSGLVTDIGLHEHDTFLTVGSKLHDPDCG